MQKEHREQNNQQRLQGPKQGHLPAADVTHSHKLGDAGKIGAEHRHRQNCTPTRHTGITPLRALHSPERGHHQRHHHQQIERHCARIVAQQPPLEQHQLNPVKQNRQTGEDQSNRRYLPARPYQQVDAGDGEGQTQQVASGQPFPAQGQQQQHNQRLHRFEHRGNGRIDPGQGEKEAADFHPGNPADQRHPARQCPVDTQQMGLGQRQCRRH